MNLAYYEPSGVADAKWVELEPAPRVDRPETKSDNLDAWYEEEETIKLFGR